MSDKYYGEFGQVTWNDDLEAAGDGITKFIRNIEVADDAEIKRGMLLCASAPTGVYSLAGAGDSGKYFVIARDDFEATSDTKVTQAFSMGRFHREKIITSGNDSTVLDGLELELRRQNIHLTSIKDKFGHFDKWSL